MRIWFVVLLLKSVVSGGPKVVFVDLEQGRGSTYPSLPRTVPILVVKVCIFRRQEVLIFGEGCKRLWEVQNPKVAQKTDQKQHRF